MEVHGLFNGTAITAITATMPHPVILLASVGAVMLAGQDSAPRIELAQMSIHQRIIVRIPRMPRMNLTGTERPMEWKERKGPKCVAPVHIVGATVTTPTDVDLWQDDGTRLRAKLKDDCDALTYYTGFYIRPGTDGRVCAKRDPIRTRSGGRCVIDRFKTLRAKR